MDRATRRVRHTLGDRPVASRRDVGTAHSSIAALLERRRQVAQPVRIRPGVVVQVGHDLARGGLPSGIPRAAQTAILGLDQPEPKVLGPEHGARVGRAVVHEDHLEIRVAQLGQTLHASPEGAIAIVRTDHDGYRRPLTRAEGHLRERPPDGIQRGLGWRSRPVTPKSQSSIGSPPRCHSSVQENTNAPAHPDSKDMRSCPSRLWAWTSWPLRRLSRPISAIISGRSPATFCSRARYRPRSPGASRYTLKHTRSRNGSSRYSVDGKLTYVTRACGSSSLAARYSLSMNRSTRRRPCQRTIKPGSRFPPRSTYGRVPAAPNPPQPGRGTIESPAQGPSGMPALLPRMPTITRSP